MHTLSMLKCFDVTAPSIFISLAKRRSIFKHTIFDGKELFQRMVPIKNRIGRRRLLCNRHKKLILAFFCEKVGFVASITSPQRRGRLGAKTSSPTTFSRTPFKQRMVLVCEERNILLPKHLLSRHLFELLNQDLLIEF